MDRWRIGGWVIVLGLIVFGFQIYEYLRTGSWLSVSVISTLAWCGIAPIANWAAVPNDWIGLHRILSMIPTSLALIVVGSITALV